MLTVIKATTETPPKGVGRTGDHREGNCQGKAWRQCRSKGTKLEGFSREDGSPGARNHSPGRSRNLGRVLVVETRYTGEVRSGVGRRVGERDEEN